MLEAVQLVAQPVVDGNFPLRKLCCNCIGQCCGQTDLCCSMCAVKTVIFYRDSSFQPLVQLLVQPLLQPSLHAAVQ